MDKIDNESYIKSIIGDELWNIYVLYNKGLEFKNNDEDFLSYFDVWLDNIKFDIAYSIYKRAIYYVPVDTGRLRNSAYIKKYEDGFVVGFDTPYAIYVHEIGKNEHKYPTRYKFLEDAAFEVGNESTKDLGLYINLNMCYDPLCVFIGVSNIQDSDIVSIYKKSNDINNIIKQALKDFNITSSIHTDNISFDIDTQLRGYSYWNVKRDRSNNTLMNVLLKGVNKVI